MINEHNKHEIMILRLEIDRVRELLYRLLTINGGNTTSQNVIRLSRKLDRLLIEYIKSCNDMNLLQIGEQQEYIQD